LKIGVGPLLGFVIGVTDVVADQSFLIAIKALSSHRVGAGNTEEKSLQDLFKKALGTEGEAIAANFLKECGYTLLEKNYRCRLGEVDLVGKKGEGLYFIEVKTRRSFDSVSPRELISKQKQKHLSKVAQHYLSHKKLYDCSARFLVVIVDCSGEIPQCELIEDAFVSSWGS